MTTVDPVEVMRFNETLAPGQTVLVRWTSSGFYYEGVGVIVKLNACSARVRLSHPVGALDEDRYSYPEGYVVTQDLCNFRTLLRWSPSNAILPLPRCPGCGVVSVLDAEHLNDCQYQGRDALPAEVTV